MPPIERDQRLPPERLELTVSDGCPLCEGPVQLRITAYAARAVCKQCEYVLAPEIAPGRSGKYELTYPPSAVA